MGLFDFFKDKDKEKSADKKVSADKATLSSEQSSTSEFNYINGYKTGLMITDASSKVTIFGTPYKEPILLGDTILFYGREFPISRITFQDKNNHSCPVTEVSVAKLDKSYGFSFEIDREYALKIKEEKGISTISTITDLPSASYRILKKAKPSSNTFICPVCKKEVSNKYKVARGVCMDCENQHMAVAPQSEPEARKQAEHWLTEFITPNEGLRNKVIPFFDRDILRLFLSTSEKDSILAILETVFDTFVVKMSIDGIYEDASRELNGNRPTEATYRSIIGGWIVSIEKSLMVISEEHIKAKVEKASTDKLISVWSMFDFLAGSANKEHCRLIFGMNNYLANVLSKREDLESYAPVNPISVNRTAIHVDTASLKSSVQHSGFIKLDSKEPVIDFYEDEVKIHSFVLGVKEDEDYTGKYFHYMVRIIFTGNPAAPACMIDGFISDTAGKDEKFDGTKIGYRFEGFILNCAGDLAVQRNGEADGCELVRRGLRYPGRTTPGNIRLVGICWKCDKTFTFNSYNFPMANMVACYSDDGLDVYQLSVYEEPTTEEEKENWFDDGEGRLFRYYNSFRCPHCGKPYIDFDKHRDYKRFGMYGCCLLGRPVYAKRKD